MTRCRGICSFVCPVVFLSRRSSSRCSSPSCWTGCRGLPKRRSDKRGSWHSGNSSSSNYRHLILQRAMSSEQWPSSRVTASDLPTQGSCLFSWLLLWCRPGRTGASPALVRSPQDPLMRSQSSTPRLCPTSPPRAFSLLSPRGRFRPLTVSSWIPAHVSGQTCPNQGGLPHKPASLQYFLIL